LHNVTVRGILLLAFALPLLAQPQRPEVFGLIGYGVAQGDEGSEGRGVSGGGAVHLPFARHWALDFAVQHIRTRRTTGGNFEFGTHRTLLSPVLVYRRGTDRLYWFGGAGIGGRVENSYSHSLSGDFSASDSGWTLPFRTGMVAAITERVLLRAELYAVWSYVKPDTGTHVGVGYRF
jgi:hypothetical protein